MALNLKATLELIGSPSQATLYRWMKDGWFPRPIKTGPRKVAWDEDLVERWLANRRAASVEDGQG